MNKQLLLSFLHIKKLLIHSPKEFLGKMDLKIRKRRKLFPQQLKCYKVRKEVKRVDLDKCHKTRRTKHSFGVYTDRQESNIFLIYFILLFSGFTANFCLLPKINTVSCFLIKMAHLLN